jgi:hypothetical protein
VQELHDGEDIAATCHTVNFYDAKSIIFIMGLPPLMR